MYHGLVSDVAVPYGDPDGFDEDQWAKSGWHPTLAQPIPSMQCTGAIRNGERAGERCRQRALLGASVCIVHGARLPNVRSKAAAIVESARLKLIDSSDEAADWLIDLGRNANSEAVRLGAAKEVLDRAGVRGGTEVDVVVSSSAAPADILRERLAKLKDRSVAADRGVIDGELAQTVLDDDTVIAAADGDDQSAVDEEPNQP